MHIYIFATLQTQAAFITSSMGMALPDGSSLEREIERLLQFDCGGGQNIS